MFFKEIQERFDYTGVRELGQFSDLEIRLKNVTENTSEEISRILNELPINNYDLIGNYLNINFIDNYLRNLFLSLSINKNKEDKTVLIHFFSPNLGQNIHLGVLRNILLGVFISNIYKSKYTNIKTETMLCNSGEVFETMLSFYKGEDLFIHDDFGENPLFEYENKAKEIVKSKEYINNSDNNKESREKVINFALNYFKIQLSKLGISFDEVILQSDSFRISPNFLGLFDKHFDIFRESDGLGIIIDTYKNPQMIINQNGTPTYLLRELNGIILKYQEGFKEQVFIVGIDQQYHFETVKKILGSIYPEINIITYFHNMLVLKDGKDKKSAKKYTLKKIIGLLEEDSIFLNYFSKENILLLHLISDIFIAKKDKEVIFTGVFENKDITIRIIKNYIYLKNYVSFENNTIFGVKAGLNLYKGIIESIKKQETTSILNSLAIDYSAITFGDEIELEKFIQIFKYGLQIIGIKPIN